MEPSIIRLKHGTLLFAQTIGMASLSKTIRKELGYPISSEEGQLWWIYQIENKLIGFCSAIIKKNEVHFCHDFVYTEFRNKGIYSKLFSERMLFFIQSKKITAVATNMSVNTYLKNGFTILNKTKNYNTVTYEKTFSNRTA